MDLQYQDQSAIDSFSGLPPVALIPAFKPENSLPSVARALLDSKAVRAVIVVDDGSGPESGHVFEELSDMEGVHLLAHAVNRGKGAALKTGLNFASHHYPDCPGVVTADADGQHAPDDVAKVAQELQKHPHDIILGSRSFNGEVPLRSRFGNELTRYIFQAFSGQKLKDTQTGLRGIPTDLIPAFSALRPNGYDFELEMLLASKSLGRSLREVGIRTIYVDGNKTSHFKPLRDSLKIYAVFLRFTCVSLFSAIIDNALFLIAFALCGNILLSQCCGRGSALLFNYFANKNAVFYSREKITTSMPRFLLIAAIWMIVSYSMIRIAVSFGGLDVMIAKIGVESLLFFLSFVAQKFFVFHVSAKREFKSL
jgi:glycosyltransferase involved in cell wall biosynthesis